MRDIKIKNNNKKIILRKTGNKDNIFSPSHFFLKNKDKKIEKENKERSVKSNTDNVVSNKKNNNIQLPEKIEWFSREFVKNNNGSNWKYYLIVTSFILLGFSIITKDPIMGIVFGLIIAVVYLLADRQPNQLKINIDPKGISIEDKNFTYNELKSFWIFYDPPRKKVLSLVSKKIFLPAINIQLENQNPILVRRYLMQYMEEEEKEESTLDMMADNLNL